MKHGVDIVIPFLKWAGGKRWLVSRYRELFPTKFRRYYEPFLGGGAVFFYINPPDAFLSDANADLINCYDVLRTNWRRLVDLLEMHQRNHSASYYYAIRNATYRSRYDCAAQFIYLNRTCWNGLYRVNLDGRFNVPKGTKTSVLLDTDNFEETSRRLKTATLKSCDFESCIDLAGEGDFVFVDPPYTVKHNYNGFVKYNEKLFSWADQIRLRDALDRAVGRGAKILLTNANHDSIRDLYHDFRTISVVTRPSVLAANSAYRTSTDELVVRSW